jgi:hypothetical protein
MDALEAVTKAFFNCANTRACPSGGIDCSAPLYFGAGARIAASTFSSASIFACIAMSRARGGPALKNTSSSTGASSLAV